MSVLLVKMSSMGDIFHTFPALSDAAAALPGVEIDWVVEEGFSTIAGWHPAVRSVIAIGQRRWLKQRSGASLREFLAWRRHLQLRQYDCVIDAQGLFKSALVARLAHGTQLHGYDRTSAREGLASWLYPHQHAVATNQHAVERTRQLLGQALGYSPQGGPRFGIATHFTNAPSTPGKLVFVVGTSWQSKLWSSTHWQALCRLAAAEAYEIELIWGSQSERELAASIADGCANAAYADTRLDLESVAQRLVTSRGVVGLDTGFTHLAGALEVPTVGLFGPTSPSRVGLIGAHTENLKLHAAMDCQPCHKRNCRLLAAASQDTAPCLARIDPERVWHALGALMRRQT